MSVITDSPSFSVRGGTIRPRLSQVYVEIPRSPLVVHLHQTSTKDCKENAFSKLSITLANTTSSKMSSSKRKIEDSLAYPSKKLKNLSEAGPDPTNVDLPCHHCRKRKPLREIIQCTRLTHHGSRCKALYCEYCLQSKYNIQLDAVRTVRRVSTLGSEQGHVAGEYIFSCPRCDGRCSCGPCRKKGLIGISQIQHGTSKNNVLQISTNDDKLVSNPQAGDVTAPKPRRRKVSIPEPRWVRFLPEYGREEVEDRLYIREFVLRFNPILNIGVKNLEELDDPSSLHDSSTKAILLALLDIIALEAEVNVKEIRMKLKAIQGLGFNWSKIISVIDLLRSLVPNGHPFHFFPSIQETDSSYNIRGGRHHGFAADSLLPLLLHMIDVVCCGASIREEIEVGNEQSRKARSNHYAALKNQSDKWNEEKQGLMNSKPDIQSKEEMKAHEWSTQYKEAEAKHKVKVADLHNYFRLDINSCASRFEPLGVDTDGRIYYLPSSLGPYRGKKDRLPSVTERSSFRKWGWFVLVYGKPGSRLESDAENQTDLDSHEEGWWAFADVSEIRKLSKWLTSHAKEESMKAVGDGHETPSGNIPNDMKLLPKAINEFADFVDWREKRGTNK